MLEKVGPKSGWIFAITLKDHHNLGWTFAAHLVCKPEDKDFLVIQESVTASNLESCGLALEQQHKKIVGLISEYDDKKLLQLFCKKKNASLSEFLRGMSREDFEAKIRPYIERKLYAIGELLAQHDVPLYLREGNYNNLHPNDRIQVPREPATTVFNYVRNAHESRYFLNIRQGERRILLHQSNGQVICNAPCVMVLDHTLHRFEDIDAKKLQPFFRREYVPIAKSTEATYFSSAFVLNSLAQHEVQVQGIGLDELDPPKKALARLSSDLAGELGFELVFRYGEQLVRPDDPKTTWVEPRHTDTQFAFARWSRDAQWEQAKRLALESIGLSQNRMRHFVAVEGGQPHQTIDWLKKHKRHLLDMGFELEIDSQVERYSLAEGKVSLEVNPNNDWFDLKGVVQVEGFSIPFERFADNILSHRREFILPNGRIFLIPEEWFQEYSDLFLIATKTEHGLRLEKHHFTVLEGKKGIPRSIWESFRELSQNQESAPMEVPKGIRAELRAYQRAGFSWMARLAERGFGACLADDMGLGKTLQAISLMQKLNEQTAGKIDPREEVHMRLFGTKPKRMAQFAALVACPASLIFNWLEEVRKFAPDLSTLAHQGADRCRELPGLAGVNVVVTSYGTLRNDVAWLAQKTFDLVVLDESHYLKNPSSKSHQAIKQLDYRHIVALTGTPVENSLTDLWAQMSLLNPGLLGSLDYFRETFVVPIEKQNHSTAKAQLHALVRPFLLRRNKSEVATELPKVSEQVVLCRMTDNQRNLYEEEKSKARNALLSADQAERKNLHFRLLQSLNRMRQIANHPKMLKDSNLLESGKFDAVVEHLESILEEGHKVLVFSSFVKHLQIFREWMDAKALPYAWLTGDSTDRREQVQRFQSQDELRVFFISLKAGGVGLNLTQADYVFLLDPWWNPAAEQQAIDRAHRIGQERSVFVYRFISKSTVEEKIRNLQRFKKRLAVEVLQGEEGAVSISLEDLEQLFD